MLANLILSLYMGTCIYYSFVYGILCDIILYIIIILFVYLYVHQSNAKALFWFDDKLVFIYHALHIVWYYTFCYVMCIAWNKIILIEYLCLHVFVSCQWMHRTTNAHFSSGNGKSTASIIHVLSFAMHCTLYCMSQACNNNIEWISKVCCSEKTRNLIKNVHKLVK